MTPIREAITLIHYQSVSELGKEFPELCDGTIALYLAQSANASPDVIRILQEYTEVERWLKVRFCAL